MRGEILNFDETSNTGVISGDDGRRYTFAGAALAGAGVVRSGQRVDFAASDGEATGVTVLADAAPAAGAFGSAGSTYAAASTSAAANAGIDWKGLFLSFQGRIRRQHFWIAWLILLGASFVAGLIPILGLLISLALLWPSFAIQVKRLHDMGKTGWLCVIPLVIGLLGGIGVGVTAGAAFLANQAGVEAGDPSAIAAAFGPAAGLLGLLVLLSLAYLLWIGVTPSQKGPNKYGPNPKGE